MDLIYNGLCMRKFFDKTFKNNDYYFNEVDRIQFFYGIFPVWDVVIQALVLFVCVPGYCFGPVCLVNKSVISQCE